MSNLPMNIVGASASEVCANALRYFTGDGQWRVVAPRGMPVREHLRVTYCLTNPMACVPWLEGRRLNYGFMAAEFAWIWLGRDDVASISLFCKNIAGFSDDGQVFFGAYGPPISRQVQYILRTLRADPMSRQAVLTIWRECPPATKDVPCTVSMQFLVRDGQLHGIVTMRSSDAWLGLPYDVFNFSRILAVLAAELSMPVGVLTIQVGSAHLYERNLAEAMLAAKAKLMPIRSAPMNTMTPLERYALRNALQGDPTARWEEDTMLYGWHEIFAALRYHLFGGASFLVGGLGQATANDLQRSE